MCAQSKALGTHTKFQLEILIRSASSAIHKFRKNILESSRKLMKQPPGELGQTPAADDLAPYTVRLSMVMIHVFFMLFFRFIAGMES